MKISKLLSTLAAFAAALIFAGGASAHTTSLGFVPGSNNGEVTFWTGSYSHGGTAHNEGTVTLAGINSTTFGPTTLSFDITPTGVRPAGLVDGSNNFFWGPFSGSSYPFPVSTDPNLFGGVVWWQGVTFTGLNPGDYSFTCGSTCGTTQQWNSLNGTNGALNLLNLTLTGQNIGGGGTSGNVPEPVTGLLLGVGIMGLAFLRRRA